jgi:diguanylate cyclase (GGDEF)-like protein
MKPKRSRSISSSLVLLVLSCILPALIIAALLIYNDYKAARTAFIRNALATAQANAQEVDREFSVVEAALAALSTSPSLAAGDLRAFHQQATELSEKQAIFNIILEDFSGQQLVNTLLPFGSALPQDKNGAALTYIREHRKNLISNLFTGPVSKRQVVSLGVPLRTGTPAPYVLSATITVDRFSALLAHQSYPSHWITGVLDTNGVITGRTADVKKTVGQKAGPEMLKRLKLPYGDFATQTSDGKPVQVVFAKAATSGWIVAIGIPLENLYAELAQKLGTLVLGTCLLLGSGFFTAWYLGSKIKKSIRRLVAPSLALGAGESIEAAVYGLREADEVGAALVQASRMHQLAQHQAMHDALTGLPNRAMLYEFLERQLGLCERNAVPLSLLYLDLDRFKIINDTHGHAVGDQLLQQASARLTSVLRKSDLAARLGGDEFAVVLVGVDDAAKVVEKLNHIMAQPYIIEDIELLAGASIGVAHFSKTHYSSHSLLVLADENMYKAKHERKQRAAG